MVEEIKENPKEQSGSEAEIYASTAEAVFESSTEAESTTTST